MRQSFGRVGRGGRNHIRLAALASAASTALGMFGFVPHARADVVYWTGTGAGFAGSDGVTWATAANWAANSAGTSAGYSPLSTTTAYFDASNASTPTGMVLGAPTSIYELYINDAAGISLNNDTSSDALTVGTGGINMSTSGGGSTIAAPVIINQNETWTNSSGSTSNYSGGNGITLSGGFSPGNSTLTVSGGDVGGYYFTGSSTISTGGGFTANYQDLTINNPIQVTANQTWTNNQYETFFAANGLVTLNAGTALAMAGVGTGQAIQINGGLTAPSGGSLTVNSGAVNFNGAQTLTGGSTASTALNISESAAGSSVVMNKNLTTSGYVNIVVANLTMNNGCNLTVGNHAVFEVTGSNTGDSASINVQSGGVYLASASNASYGSFGYNNGFALTFQSGSELAGNGYAQGSGSYAKPVNLPGGTTISAGNGATTGGTTGKLNDTSGTSSLTLALGSSSSTQTTYLWKINDAAGTGGTADGWDQLALYSLATTGSGTVRIEAESFSDTNGDAGGMANVTPNQSYQFLIATLASGSFNLSNFSLDTSDLGFASENPGTYSLAATGGNLYLDYTASAVPEPASLGLLGLAVTGLTLRRRSRVRCPGAAC